MDKQVLSEMLKKWESSVVCRGEIRRFSGGMVSPKTLANLDSQGEGPKGAFRYGSKVAYPVSEVVSWLETRSRPMRDGRPNPRDRERGSDR